jgi:hypothetical protein
MAYPSRDQIEEFLKQKNIGPCEACGVTKWGLPEPNAGLYVQFPQVNERGEVIFARGVPAVSTVCKNCGNIRFHSMATIRGEW